VQRRANAAVSRGGDVFAAGAIAARRRPHQCTVLVAQTDRQTIELWLDRKQRFAIAGLLDDTAHEGVYLVIAERIAERQHRQLVHHLGKLRRRSVAHPLGG